MQLWVPACAGTNGESFSAVLFSLSRPRLLGQIAPQPLAYLVGLFRRPGAKAFAALHAELAGLDLLLQERMRVRTAIQVGDEHVADVEGEIEPDEIGLFHRAEYRHASAEAALYHRVDRLGVADAGGDERDRLTLQRMLQAVADEARNVAAHMDRLAACSGKEIDGAENNIIRGPFGLDHLVQRHEMRRIPEVRADHALAVLEVAADLGRWDRRAVACQKRIGRGERLKLAEDALL